MNCSCCDAVAEAHKTVACLICKRVFKIDCVGVSSSDARKIHTNTGMSWSCRDCREIGDDTSCLKAAIVALQGEIKALKTALLTKASSQEHSILDTERVIQEVAERERRKTNIIIYGSGESTAATREERFLYDATVVKSAFIAMGVEVPQLEVTRIGRFIPDSPDHCRPIKVRLPSEADVVNVLKNSGKLKPLNDWKNIYMSRDRTLMQRDVYKHVKKQLQDRLASGETELRIKYKNGIPTIIKSLN